MKSAISEEIKPGDLVIMGSWGQRTHLGFYIGRGKGNSVQYYSVYRLRRWMEDKRNWKMSKEYFGCLTDKMNELRIAKYSPDLLNPEMKEQYEIAKEALTFLITKS